MAFAYSQSGRPFRIETPLGQDVLCLARLRGREAISELFHFRAELVSRVDEQVPFDGILGQSVGIEINLPGRLTRRIHGMVSDFEEKGRDDVLAYYQADIVPRFWLWTQRRQSRVFQGKSVPEILQEVLQDLAPNRKFTIFENYPVRDYCTQYRETDFAFASRLMEEEGLSYYFEHDVDKHVLVVTDSAVSHPKLPAGAKVRVDRHANELPDHTFLTQWGRRQSIRNTRVSLRDYHFELSNQVLQAQADLPSTVAVGSIQQPLLLPQVGPLEDYDYPGNYAKWFDGVNPQGNDQASTLQQVFSEQTRQTKLRCQETAARTLTIHGQGNCGQFTPGYQFELERHGPADGNYLIVSVEHELETDYDFHQEMGKRPYYRNRFEGLPSSMPFRPRRSTPAPVISGPQTAVVVGPSGQEIFLDKYGRIKVQFPWDRQGQKDGANGCWIRVAQLWAGPNWGAFFWPRVGNEVVVAFEDGDPDRPLVVGSVYNVENMPPVNLPEQQMTAGIKSCVFGKNPAEDFNSLAFLDIPSAPFVHIHSADTEVQNSITNRVQYVPVANYRFHGSLPGLGG